MNTLQRAYREALKDVGKGGDGERNNVGQWLSIIRRYTELPKLGGGAWCAVAISYWICLVDGGKGHLVKSRGARKLVLNILDRGGRQIELEEMRPGDVAVALYRRGTRQHHVRLLRRNRWRWEYVGGNETRRDIVRRKRWLKKAQVERGLLKLAVLP